MSERKTPAIWIAVAVLSLLLSGYVGMYRWLVQPEFVLIEYATGAHQALVIPQYGNLEEDGEGLATIVFAPVHWFDRRFRPHVWEPAP